jgi:hypothetical protein
MAYKTFNNWLFDGKRHSTIPTPKVDDNGKIVIPDILKYNSPITHTFIVSLFLRNGSLNKFLNKHFNDINLRYINKEDLFKFIKMCVIDFKIKKRDIMFYRRKPRYLLYEKLREKMPLLKNDDINLLCEIVEKSNNKDSIYDSLGLDKPKKMKMKKAKKIEGKKISVNKLLNDHFSMIDVS